MVAGAKPPALPRHRHGEASASSSSSSGRQPRATMHGPAFTSAVLLVMLVSPASSSIRERRLSHQGKNFYRTSGSNCDDDWSSCDICASSTEHYGCHAQLDEWSAGGEAWFLNTQDCATFNDDILHWATEEDGFGQGESVCWDPAYHGSQDGRLVRSVHASNSELLYHLRDPALLAANSVPPLDARSGPTRTAQTRRSSPSQSISAVRSSIMWRAPPAFLHTYT